MSTRQEVVEMNDKKLMVVLKIVIVIGLCLLLLGHYLLSYAHLPEKMGITGIIISAACIALGLVLSLPTKMYLTFVIMKKENEQTPPSVTENSKPD